DVKMDSSPTDCGASRFRDDGSHEPVIDFVKRVTDKPVVGVGRFTSADTMVSQIKRGVLDLIGGARPGIADPFLPNKIRDGKIDEIRECIGCNICISSWHDGVPVRCTQNATAGEEWRRGWHPEKFNNAGSDDNILILGAGPAGLEAALIAARRGYQVTLADRREEFGGRLIFETSLPGLNAWGRVRDYRMQALQQLGNVDMYPGSEMAADDVLAMEHSKVVIATGARWTRFLYSSLEIPVGRMQQTAVYTPDDLANDQLPQGPVLVYDFDNYYMGGVVAEYLTAKGLKVSYATPAGHASAWTVMTNEQPFIHQAFHQQGIELHTLMLLKSFDGNHARLENIFSGAASDLEVQSIVIVGHRQPVDNVYQDLIARENEFADAGIKSVQRIGDALAPGAIVHAVHSGHQYAQQLDNNGGEGYLRDIQIGEDAPAEVYRGW
ncbi:MAG: NAD(P)-binding protein, partial [Xanthomonadales bacterium]|nr:NAD(P)-binding protein [Xanthomonadales bacterium]